MRRLYLALSLWLLFGALALAAEKRPNIVAIVTDDQGRWAVGAYGNRDVHTPHMDSLARDGALFSNAFTVTPVCSPSRAAYMSGRWPTQTGINDWIAPQEGEAGKGLDALTWPQVLQRNGYKTALVGKWHLGTQPQFHPTRRGFDHFYGFVGGGAAPMDPTLEVNGKPQSVSGPVPDLITTSAIDFIRAHRDEPFAVCVHFREPHRPYAPVPAEDSAHYKSVDPSVPQVRGLDIPALKKTTLAYYASVSAVDRNLGRLLAALDELKLSEQTLVMFTSDHGYNEGRHGIDTKGNGRWIAGGVTGPARPNMWDTSIRIPLMVRWPQVVKPRTVIEDDVTNLDTFRTVLGAVGVTPPSECTAQGRDTSPLLRGQKLDKPEAIFGQYDLRNGGLAYLRMIRTPQYKFVKHYRANYMDELYDLQADPDELRNLLGGQGQSASAKVRSDLERRLIEWQRSIDDPVLTDPY